MTRTLAGIKDRGVERWRALSPGRRALVIAAPLALAVTLTLLFVSTRPGEQILFTGLEAADASAVVERLKAMGVPYAIVANAGTISVPEDVVDEVRLTLAGEGLPMTGEAGFSMFRDPNFGLSDFDRRVNFQHALENELARTIRSIDAVRSARVHVPEYKKALFSADEVARTAAVMLVLKPGRNLERSEVRGIGHMVAYAVRRLRPENVLITDSTGRILSDNGDDDRGTAGLESTRWIERDLEGKAQSLLDAWIGAGRSVVRVVADVDLSRASVVEERYDPEGSVIRSESMTTSRSSDSASVASGVPGAESALPPGKATRAKDGSGAETMTRTTNYETSKSVRRTESPPAVIRRISVAVMIDVARSDATDEDEGSGGSSAGAESAGRLPRTPEELARIDSLVRKAVGFQEARGDTIEVTSFPFHSDEVIPEAGVWVEVIQSPLLRSLLWLAAVALVVLLLGRPALRLVTGPAAASGKAKTEDGVSKGETGRHGESDAFRDGEVDEEDPANGDPHGRVLELIAREPHRAAEVVRSWLDDSNIDDDVERPEAA